MSYSDYERAVDLGITALAEAFRQNVTDITLNAYQVALRGMTAAEVAQVCETALRTASFMPSARELRENFGVDVDAERKAAIRLQRRIKAEKRLAQVEARKGLLKEAAARLVFVRELKKGKMSTEERAKTWRRFLNHLQSEGAPAIEHQPKAIEDLR